MKTASFDDLSSKEQKKAIGAIAHAMGVAEEDVTIDHKTGHVSIAGKGKKGGIIVVEAHDDDDFNPDIIRKNGKAYIAVEDAKKINDEMIEMFTDMQESVLEMVNDIGEHCMELSKALTRGQKKLSELKSKNIDLSE